MTNIKIEVPSRLTYLNSISFIQHLRSLEDYEKVIFDFSKLEYIDPFSLLFVSSEIERYRKRLKDSIFQAVNYKHCSYPAHMGFFQAFGMPFGKKPGEAKGSPTYIPINIYDTEEIIEEARELMINPAELLESRASEIANILASSQNSNLNEVLTYCIREIFRNVVEHSKGSQFGFCAQFRPSKQMVSFSIIDRGIGLRNSLKNNPTIVINNDEDAIRLALQPAISGKVYKGQKRKPKGEWANSGYGLFMISNICKKGGGFFIASGEVGYFVSENKERTLETPFNGTALNLVLQTDRLKDLNTMLREIEDVPHNSKGEPSKSSMGLMNSK